MQNDIYFRVHRENHNIDRARTQMKLVEDMEKVLPTMNEIVYKYKSYIQNRKYSNLTLSYVSDIFKLTELMAGSFPV